MNKIDKYKKVVEAANYLVSLGTATKPSRDFERAFKRGLKQLEGRLIALELDVIMDTFELSEAQVQEDIEISKKYAIRPIWLNLGDDND